MTRPPSPLVSVIVPVYNGAAFLLQALQSARDQALAKLEVIVINDGSTDASGAIAEAFAAQGPADAVQVIHQANGGLCAARNAGLAAARGEFIALLDADDVWLPHHLAASVAAFDNHPNAGLVHANIDWMAVGGESQGLPPRGRWQAPHQDAWAAIFLRQQHVSCPTAVFRRRLLEQTGPFDLRFNRLGCEDRDLWLRLAALSEVVYLDTVHARYRLHANSMSRQRELMTRARLLLIEKHAATPPGRALRREALAAVRVEQGDEFRSDGRRADALLSYARAFLAHPWSLRPLKASVGTLLKKP